MNQPKFQNRLFGKTILTTTLYLVVSCVLCTVVTSRNGTPVIGPGACTIDSDPEITAGKNYESQMSSSTCVPELMVQHYAVLCLNQEGIAKVDTPVFHSACSEVTQLDFEEEYLDLTCAMSGFEGYFHPSNWTGQTIYGDGGVDVTGAPNITLVEGANKALLETASGKTAVFKIVIPANGIATFDWSNFGGSKFFYSLHLNGRSYPINKLEHQNGSFRTPVLRIGDQLEFQVKAPEIGSKIELSNFNFYSNTIGLMKRHWKALDSNEKECKATQLIAIEKANISDIIFPLNRDGKEAPMLLDDESAYSPEVTGYPVIDRDGDPESKEDQFLLKNDACTFQINWTDEWSNEDKTFIIARKWIVQDVCSDNYMEATQIIKLDKLPSSRPLPGFLPQKTVPVGKRKKTEGKESGTTNYWEKTKNPAAFDKNYEPLLATIGQNDYSSAENRTTNAIPSTMTSSPYGTQPAVVEFLKQSPPPRHKEIQEARSF